MVVQCIFYTTRIHISFKFFSNNFNTINVKRDFSQYTLLSTEVKLSDLERQMPRLNSCDRLERGKTPTVWGK
jgi:hypothetical protein